MFKSKYIFETKHTRMMRYFTNFLLGCLIFTLFYAMLCLIFILVSENENKASNERLFKRPPDLIVVFTGHKGRIPFALKKAQEFNQSHIFITGVNSKNSVNTLLTPLDISASLNPQMLELDYQARNTVENVIFTLRYLRKNENLNRILIISHDYHIMRIKLIAKKLTSRNDQREFYYLGIKTDYTEMRNIKILVKEVYKLLRTSIFLLFWDF